MFLRLCLSKPNLAVNATRRYCSSKSKQVAKPRLTEEQLVRRAKREYARLSRGQVDSAPITVEKPDGVEKEEERRRYVSAMRAEYGPLFGFLAFIRAYAVVTLFFTSVGCLLYASCVIAVRTSEIGDCHNIVVEMCKVMGNDVPVEVIRWWKWGFRGVTNGIAYYLCPHLRDM